MANSFFQPITLLASAARTTTTVSYGDTVQLLNDIPGLDVKAIAFMLDVTADEHDAGDTLDVVIQTQLDNSTWLDVAYFTQHTGDVGARQYYLKIVSDAAQTAFAASTALTATNVRNLMGRNWRVKYTIVDSGDHDQSFTFSVVAVVM